MSDSLLIRTPARLHFGLLRPGIGGGARSGGLGLMIDQPPTVLRITPGGDGYRMEGRSAERIRRWISMWQGSEHDWDLPPFELVVEQAPPFHGGLGSGTQLALAAVTGLASLFDRPLPDLLALARQLGRARRSAVGSVGFRAGGLVYDPGADEGLDKEDAIICVALPAAWRVVLLIDRARCGPSGRVERRLFEQLEPPPPRLVGRLVSLAEQVIVPAARRGDFEDFAAGVAHYGKLAGDCYRRVERERTLNDLAARRLAWLTRHGAPAAAQSSWGPATFALLPDETAAIELVERLQGDLGKAPESECLESIIAQPARGADVTRSVLVPEER